MYKDGSMKGWKFCLCDS